MTGSNPHQGQRRSWALVAARFPVPTRPANPLTTDVCTMPVAGGDIRHTNTVQLTLFTDAGRFSPCSAERRDCPTLGPSRAPSRDREPVRARGRCADYRLASVPLAPPAATVPVLTARWCGNYSFPYPNTENILVTCPSRCYSLWRERGYRAGITRERRSMALTSRPITPGRCWLPRTPRSRGGRPRRASITARAFSLSDEVAVHDATMGQ